MHRNALAVTEAAAARGLTISVVEHPGEGARTAAEAAAAIGVEVGQIVKSLVFAMGDAAEKDRSEPVMALVCGDDQLDTRLLAKAAGVSSAWRMDAKAVRDATGYPVGGIPPLGHVTKMRTFADTRLRRFVTVWAAAGTPSHVFEVAVEDLMSATNATWADLSSPVGPASNAAANSTPAVRPVTTTSNAPASTTDASTPLAPPTPDAPLAVTHPRATGRDVLGTIPLSARPARLSALPSVTARAVAFAVIVLGGLIGGLLTYAVRKVMSGKTSGTSIGVWTVAGAVGTAFGTGILAILALRAMGEWRSLNQAETLTTILGND